jgi:hypothetical protein
MARRIKDLAGQTDLLGMLEPAHQGRIEQLEAENAKLRRQLAAYTVTDCEVCGGEIGPAYPCICPPEPAGDEAARWVGGTSDEN